MKGEKLVCNPQVEGNKTSKAGKNYGNEFRNLFQSLEPGFIRVSIIGFNTKYRLDGKM